MAAVIQAGTVTTAGRCQFQLVRKHLWVTLPSGRGLVYPFATIMPHTTPWGMAKDSVSYMALGKNKKWQQETTYGGKLTENLDQAISRDIMAGAMLAAEQVGWECVLTVHDEVVCECDPAKADVPAFERLMATVPPWAPGLALAAKGWTGRRYRK
jgi:DNA polymerase